MKTLTKYILLVMICMPAISSAQNDSAFLFTSNSEIVPADYLIDDAGNHYIYGEMRDSLWLGDSLILVNKGYRKDSSVTFYSIFLCKISPTGKLVYALRAGLNGTDTNPHKGEIMGPEKMVLDNNNNVILTGVISSDTLEFENQSLPLDTHEGINLFILKVNANGQTELVKNIKVRLYDPHAQVADILVDNSNNIIISGTYKGLFLIDHDTLEHSGSSAFILKLSPAGEVVWAKALKSSLNAFGLALSKDNMDGFYLTGVFIGEEFILGKDTLGNNSFDSYITRIDSNGEFLWSKQVREANSFNAVIADSHGMAYVFGPISDTVLAKYNSNGDVLWAHAGNHYNDSRGRDVLCISKKGLVFGGNFYSSSVSVAGAPFYNPANTFEIFFGLVSSTGELLGYKTLGDVSNELLYDIAETPQGELYAVLGFDSFTTINGRRYEAPKGREKEALLIVPVGEFNSTGAPEVFVQNPGISIFPNPSSNHFQVKFPAELIGKSVSMSLYDMIGRQLQQIRTEEASTLIDASGLPAGIYYLGVFQGDEFISSHKLIKQ